MYNATWNDFIGKNSNNLTGTFEDLARYLFRKKYDVGYALPYFKNHPGNETAVINRGDDVIGFQAKYFENEIDANNIIHSIQLAKEWHPNQTIMVIYTNKEFGVPKTKGKKTSSKQDKIQKAANEIGLKLEWIFGDNILDIVKDCPVAYDIFFNQNSHLQNLNQQIEENNEAKFSRINSTITYGGKNVVIERHDYVEKIKTSIKNGQNLVLTGESGVGKSAIVKDFYYEEKDNEKIVIFALDAHQLEVKSLNDIFSLEENYTIKDFCGYYKEVQTKVIYIDSAEKLLECRDISNLVLLIDKFKREGWIFLFTCKSNGLQDFIETMENDYHLILEALEVKPLSMEELISFSQKENITLPEDKKLLNQLRIPFYLARYIEIGQNFQIDLSAFKERVWNQKVRGNIRGGEQQKREECLIAIASNLQERPQYYISYSEVKDKDAAYSLIEQDVLVEIIHKGYAIKHDIYSDWALTYQIEQKMSESIEKLASIPQTTDYINAFVCWLKDQLDTNEHVIDNLCEKVFNHEIADYWVSPIFYVIAREQEFSRHFIDKFDSELKANSYYWFNEYAKELYVSCKRLNRYFSYKGRQYPQYIAVGGGWETAIEYMYKNQNEYFLYNLHTVYNVLLSYIGIRQINETVAHNAGLLALRIFKEEVEAHKNSTYLYIENPEQWSSLVCLYSPYIKEEFHHILTDIIKNKWIHYKDPYHSLSEFIVKKANVSCLLPVTILYHDVLPQLLKVYWEENLNDKEYNSRRGYCKESAYFFGLNEDLDGIGEYFPSSAFQTPIYLLLKTEFDINPKLHHTFDFIIDFVNQCVETYEERGQEYDFIEKIDVILPDGKKDSIISSNALWNLYRGTSGLSMPNVLESIHMALEKFLLDLCGEKKLYDYVANLLKHILNKSHSASLWAVVASVVTAYFKEFFDILLFFYQDYRFLGLDLKRYTHEITAQTLSFASIGKELLGKERKESNELKHRQNNLEKLLLNLQASYAVSNKPQDKQRLQQLYYYVDIIKKQVSKIPQKEKRYEDYMIARIDYRSMTKEEVTLQNGASALKLTPNLTEAQKNVNIEMARANMQIVRVVRLREWINKQYTGDKYDVNNSSFNNDIHLILNEIRDIEKLLESKDSTLYKLMGDEFLPCMGSAILLLNFCNELTNEEINECKERLITSLKDMSFMLSNGLSGLEICLSAIPNLLANCSSKEENVIKKICLDYVQSTFKYGNVRPCDLMRYVFIRRNVWQKHAEFMETCVNALLELYKDQTFSVDRARAVACLLANDTSHHELLVKSMETLSSEWKPNIRDGKEYYNQERFDDSYLVADIIIRCRVSDVSEIVSFFSRYISNTDSYEPLIGKLLLKCISYGNYDQFWEAWNSLYDCIIRNIRKRNSSNIVNEYLLNPSNLIEGERKWFDFKEKDVRFFEKVLNDAGDNPSILDSVVKVFDTIGYDYAIQIVSTMASVIENKNIYDGNSTIMKSLLFNLENLIRSVITDFDSIISNNISLKQNIKTILMFMKQHGSTQAADFLRTM